MAACRIRYCLLPIAYCLLPIAYCLLPIAYCLLLGWGFGGEDGLFFGPEFFDSVDEGGGVGEVLAYGDEEVDEALVVVDSDVFGADSWGCAVGLFVGSVLGF